MFIQSKPRAGGLTSTVYTKPAVPSNTDDGFIDNVNAPLAEKGLDSFAPHAPQNVKRAWNKAAVETGVNGLGIGENGLMTHIPAALIIQLEQRQDSGSDDVFGNSVSSARDAATRILSRLENPISPETNSQIRSYQEQEKQFYRSFIGNLDDYSADNQAAFMGLRL